MANLVENIISKNYVKANELLEQKLIAILQNKLEEAKKFVQVKRFIKKTEFDKLPSNVLHVDKLTQKEKDGKLPVSQKTPKNKFLDFKVEELIEEVLNETINRNIQKAGRINIVRGRIRNGKVQRRKRVSGVQGYEVQGNRVVRISQMERRNRRLGARRAKIKRRSKQSQINRKTKLALRKRKSLGFD